MKKLFAFIAASLLVVSAFAQDGRSIYNKYSDEKGVSAVFISPAMFRLIGKIPEIDVAGTDADLTPVIKSLTGLYLIDSKNESINRQLKNDAEHFVRKGAYELLMEIKEEGETVNIFTMGKDDDITGFVLISSEPGECTFIYLDGRMSRKELEDIIGKIDV